ncbi:MAG: hypothetical protein KatS3mg114_0417 [Planctomycetaceae bacterium]|nr:MAG: hypothetical protein KatS3mg114_0417 [Planctomycetaceae bacterium]
MSLVYLLRAVNVTRVWLLLAGGASLFYALVVLWTIGITSEIRVRWLLLGERGTHALQQQTAPEGVKILQTIGLLADGPAPQTGDVLLAIHGEPIQTSLDIPKRLLELSSQGYAPLPTHNGYPWITLEYQPARSHERITTRVALQPLPLSELLPTLIWFGLELLIFSVSAVAVWRRPFDHATRVFFMMSVLALGAFLGCYHWWLLVGNRWLSLPFVISAILLPAVTLHFFLVYPRPKTWVLNYPRWVWSSLYGIPTVVLIFFLLAHYMLGAEISQPASSERGLKMLRWLSWLQTAVYAYLTVAGVYFGGALIAIVHSVWTSRCPIERRRGMWILWAGMVATLFIGYTLMLAYWDRSSFVLGGGRIPMFLASLMFMLAYTGSILRHKLLPEEDLPLRSWGFHVMRCALAGLLMIAIVWYAFGAGRRSLLLTSFQQGILGVCLVVGSTALLVGRDSLQRWLTRRWFHERYRLDKALHRINRAVGQFSDPQFLSQRTLVTCRDGVQAEWAALYLKEPMQIDFQLVASEGGIPEIPLRWEPPADWLSHAAGEQWRWPWERRSPAQETLRPEGTEIIQPIEVDGELAGVILLGPKLGGQSYSPEDYNFLSALTQITGVALHCVRVHQDLSRLNEQLRTNVERIAQQKRQIELLQAELAARSNEIPDAAAPEILQRDIIQGSSPALLEVLETVKKVAPTEATVLLRGESGTGKELLARVIHANSSRRDGPFVAVHCAALASSVLESELFGHVRGAFTGAHADKRGRFELAHGGTLFLDEIGELSLETQVKLLRALQEREIEPVGGTTPIRVNVRVIAATHRPLEEMIQRGQFREDLYYRLNVVSLWLPPLRKRQEDLHALAAYFLRRESSRLQKNVHDIDDAAWDVLLRYSWPGNIRELENVIARAVVMAEDGVITRADLPAELLAAVERGEASKVKLSVGWQPEWSGATRAHRKGQRLSPPKLTAREHYDEMDERKLLIQALQQAGGNKAQAARLLGLPRSTYFSKLKKYALQD